MKFLSLLLGLALLAWAAYLRSPLHLGVPAPWPVIVSIVIGALGWLVAWACLKFGAGQTGHLQDTTLDKLVGNTMFAPLSGRRKRLFRRGSY